MTHVQLEILFSVYLGGKSYYFKQIDLVLTNSAYHDAAFHLGLHCLPK